MKNKQTKINYTDVWGLREEKYKYLEENDIFSTKWRSIKPQEPHNFFTIKDFKGVELYDQFVPLDKIFRQFTAGVVTGKDEIFTDQNANNLKNRIVTILNSTQNEDLIKNTYGLNNSAGSKILLKRKETAFEETKIKRYHYRPLDYRYVYYETEFLERHRSYLATSMCEQNLAISVSRLTVNETFSNVIVSDCLADYKLAENTRGSYFFPLYLYNESDQQELFNQTSKSFNLQWGNLGPLGNPQTFTSDLSGNFIQPAETIFYYIYAILYSNIYREKYQEFLKIDFPRIPFTKDYELFKRLVELGEQLVQLHLLKHSELAGMTSQYNGSGTDKIEKYDYQETERRVYINNSQYFGGITPEIWQYHIGGYQVLEKWLKDRKGRTLSAEDIKHYCRMVTALAKTIEIQRQIDGLYPKVEETL